MHGLRGDVGVVAALRPVSDPESLHQARIVGEIVYNDQNLVEGSQLHLLAGLRDPSLLANNLAQFLEVGLFPVGGRLHGGLKEFWKGGRESL